MTRTVRQLNLKPDQPQETAARSFDDFADRPNLVLLGDPGAGKTHVFTQAGRREGGRFLKARAFLSLPAGHLRGQSLFIDGLDEKRAGRADRNTIDALVEKLFAVRERKDRVDDAMHATRAAVEEGIVPGGGVALLRASEHLKGLRTKNDDQKTGVEIVRKALSYPARQIAINAGEDGSVIVGKILEKDQYSYGFDSQTGEYVNLISKGIIDPTKVVRVAIQNAASVAALLITTEAMVAEVPKKNAGGGGMPPGGGGMGGMGGMDF